MCPTSQQLDKSLYLTLHTEVHFINSLLRDLSSDSKDNPGSNLFSHRHSLALIADNMVVGGEHWPQMKCFLLVSRIWALFDFQWFLILWKEVESLPAEEQSEEAWQEVTVAICSGDLQYQEARNPALPGFSLSPAYPLDTLLWSLKGGMAKVGLWPPGSHRWDAQPSLADS